MDGILDNGELMNGGKEEEGRLMIFLVDAFGLLDLRDDSEHAKSGGEQTVKIKVKH